MITKFARHRGIGGGWQVAPARTAPGNDNQLLRRVFSAPQRTSKRVLACHWRVQPQTRTLECVWETQAIRRPADAASDEDPKLRRSSGRTRRLRYGFVVGATHRAAAA
jgi:hypothetical protein